MPSVGLRNETAPWREIGRWAALGTLVLLALVLVDVRRYGAGNPVSLIQPGTNGSATALFEQDFPALEQPEGDGLDGQLYYAIARDPIHLDQTAEHLDHPRYRLQRPLLPWLAWALHPTGGGMGLVWALIAVTVAGTVAGALAMGFLSWSWRGPVWLGALFPLLPGTWWALRVTVSDALALGLALVAIALASRQRHGWAAAVGVLAVLAKEPAILILGGWWLAHRDRRNVEDERRGDEAECPVRVIRSSDQASTVVCARGPLRRSGRTHTYARGSFAVVAVPALVAAAWMGWLRVQLPADLPRSEDIAMPFSGLSGAWDQVWSQGREYVGMACTLGGFAIGGLALALRKLRHPLGWALTVQLAFMASLGVNPTAMNFGGTRMAMPVMVLAIIALATPAAGRAGPQLRADGPAGQRAARATDLPAPAATSAKT